MSYSIGQAAGVAGVTIRTLHHYEEIGLLPASERTRSGYRSYDESDLERLQRILYYRELGFPLSEITALLEDPHNDAATHLRRQHALLKRRLQRLEAMIDAVELEMEAQQMGISLTPEERFELFGDFVPEDYEKEAEERWGDTEVYKQSQRRVAAYTKQDWLKIKQEGGAIEQRLKAAFESGTAPDSDVAMDLAEEHRLQITRWFYDCSHEIHRGLGQMYVDDPRFKKHYEAIAHGLAEFLRDAAAANAARAGA
jgi:MerR family transcriptional regulator, thiopeptide resistance regulator